MLTCIEIAAAVAAAGAAANAGVAVAAGTAINCNSFEQLCFIIGSDSLWQAFSSFDQLLDFPSNCTLHPSSGLIQIFRHQNL